MRAVRGGQSIPTQPTHAPLAEHLLHDAAGCGPKLTRPANRVSIRRRGPIQEFFQ